MFEIGSSLRQARQHRGLELSDVERRTHIRAKYLGALEDERFDVLPGHAYVLGFLRTYAEFLGLNGNLYVDEYNGRYASLDEEPPPIQYRPSLQRRELRAVRRAVGVLVALAAAIGVVWQLGFTPPQRTTSGGTPPLAAPAAKRTATPKPQPRANPVAAAQRAPATLVVRATRGDCWVAVRIGSSSGPVLYEQTLAQGGVLRFGLRKPLWVRLGAPWNADVTVRGKPVAGLPHQPVNLQAA